MLDLILAGGTCTTSVLTEVSAVGGSSVTVKDRPDPRMMAVGLAGEANLQYGQITSPDLPQMGVIVPWAKLNSYDRVKGKVPANSVLTPSIFQDQGGDQTEYMGILMSYARPGRRTLQSLNGRPCGQRVAITSGSAGWGNGQALTNLRGDKMYALLGFSVQNSTDFFAIQFESNMFDGLKPGFVAEATDTQSNDDINFPDEDIPVFRGGDGLTAYAFGDGNAVNIFVNLIELD